LDYEMELPPDLAALVERWSSIPKNIRAAI
jgi:hypothetical protein